MISPPAITVVSIKAMHCGSFFLSLMDEGSMAQKSRRKDQEAGLTSEGDDGGPKLEPCREDG